MYVANIAALRALAGPLTDLEFIVAGYYTPGDGGGGTFTWIADLTPLADDTGVIIRSTNAGLINAGYYKRIFSGPINVRWFGAIISTASGLTDVTATVHAARNYAQRGNAYQSGTVYFPEDIKEDGTPQPYVGAFVFEKRTSIVGDGLNSILQRNSSGSPVLTLGCSHPYSLFKPTVSKLRINGVDKGADGVYFSDSNSVPGPEFAGRWVFENLMIENCDKGVHKPKGNIGNLFSECWFLNNTYAYFAKGYYQASPYKEMHAGCDQFIGGVMSASEKAAICVVNVGLEGYGQLIIDGLIIEGNPGFGIFVKFLPTANRMPVEAIDIRNVWMESNATSTNVTIEGVTYGTTYDYSFEQVRGVMITGSFLRKFRCLASSVLLVNCRTDGSTNEIDSTSVVTADFHRYQGAPSENIFVNSIAYDPTIEFINFPWVTTSVWGPLRVVTQTGNNNVLVSQRYDSSGYTFTDLSTSNVYPTSAVNAGILKDRCTSLSFYNGGNPVEIVDTANAISMDDDNEMYYVWSIHAYLCQQEELGQSIYGYIGTDPSAPAACVLGGVILKPNKWVCSYGVKRITGDSANPPTVYLTFGTSATGGTVLVADYQVVKFANYYDASSFLNSRAFAEGDWACDK